MLDPASGILFLRIKAKSPLKSVACGRLKRNCLVTEAIFVAVIARTASYSRAPIQRNLPTIDRGRGFYRGENPLVLAAWLYRNLQQSAVTADIQPGSFDVATAPRLPGRWDPDGTIAQDCKKSSGSETNFPAPVIRYLKEGEF